MNPEGKASTWGYVIHIGVALLTVLLAMLRLSLWIVAGPFIGLLCWYAVSFAAMLWMGYRLYRDLEDDE